MPYVTESNPPVTEVRQIRRNGVVTTTTVATGRSRSQYGYRSSSLTPTERRGIKDNSANTISLVDELEEQTSTGMWSKRARAFMVHDRDYNEISYSPERFGYVSRFQSGLPDQTDYDISSVIAITNVSLSGFTAPPSVASLQSQAASIMRGTATALRPQFNFVQAVLELKDAKRMFRAADYSFKNARALGDNYLNYMFGVKPTANDLANAALSVVQLEPALRNLMRGVKVQQRRSTRVNLNEESKSGEVSTRSGNNTYSFNVGPFTFKAPYPVAMTIGRGAVVNAYFGWYAKQTIDLHVFGNWEYFIPMPEEFDSRLNRYIENAKRVLSGSKFDESVAWELTPWSWLVDWYIDIGGILHYQLAVNENRIVPLSTGYSLSRNVSMGVTYRGQAYNATGVSSPYTWTPLMFQGGSATAVYRQTSRRKGSPYSMSPTWSLTSQQWAILAALGLTRGGTNPILG